MLSKHPNGQWCKTIQKKRYYFGTITSDPTGAAAAAEYAARLPGILAGTDHLRVVANPSGETTGDLLARYMGHLRTSLAGGMMSGKTFADYTAILANFGEWIKLDTPVASLKPEHFATFVEHLIVDRKQRAHSRKRTLAAIKTMFRWGAGNGMFVLPNFGTAMKAPPTTKSAIRRERTRAGLADYTDRIVAGAEVDKLLALAQPNMRAMILMGLNCGLGPADLGRLRWRHIDMETGKLDYARPKTGNARIGYLWKKTRAALMRCRELKHTKIAIEREGAEALVFVTKHGLPFYRERMVTTGGKIVGVKIDNAVSITFGRLAKLAELKGVSFYRLRHTFKTLGKKARDRDALNLCMGHHSSGVEAGYDHEEISFKRVKRVAIKVMKRAWPAVNTSPTTQTAPETEQAAVA